MVKAKTAEDLRDLVAKVDELRKNPQNTVDIACRQIGWHPSCYYRTKHRIETGKRIGVRGDSEEKVSLGYRCRLCGAEKPTRRSILSHLDMRHNKKCSGIMAGVKEKLLAYLYRKPAAESAGTTALARRSANSQTLAPRISRGSVLAAKVKANPVADSFTMHEVLVHCTFRVPIVVGRVVIDGITPDDNKEPH